MTLPPLTITRISAAVERLSPAQSLAWRLWQQLPAQTVPEKLNTPKEKLKRAINIAHLKTCVCLLKSVALRIEGASQCGYVLYSSIPIGHMAMNADLLAPGGNVFYLRGTTGERVPATAVGLSTVPESVAISYERSGHTHF